MITKKISSSPAVPALSGRSTVPTAARTPSIARVFTSIRPLESSASTIASTITSTTANTVGASWDGIPEMWLRNSGQLKATAPTTRATIREALSRTRPVPWADRGRLICGLLPGQRR